MTSAAILAGGRARRFDGRDKTQLRLEGRTILERQIEAIQPCTSRIFIVGYRGDARLPRGVAALADREADRGPLGGLDAALAATDGNVLLLACDMPHVSGGLLSRLTELVDGVDAVVPRTEDGYHPLCAVYAQSCRERVRYRLERGQLRMVDLLHDLRLRVVDRSEIAPFGRADRLLANVNTQADLDALESLQNH
jgi:molybdopterin-guanine dinucleotide biosynthesis protein A